MSIGLPLTKSNLDQIMGGLAVAVRDDLAKCAQFKGILDNTTIIPNDQFLINLGYTQAEVNIIRAAFTDLKKLNDIANAAATQATTNNFFFNSQLLTGVVLT